MNLNIIVKMHFGSHLYGTDTEESDVDIKGIFMPPLEDILLSRVNKSYTFNEKVSGGIKNTSEDTDVELYSLHYFIKLACEGQTVALDMLHAPDDMILESSDVWKRLASNRELFYTKNLKAFVGYARRQAAKYGIKGSRLAAAAKIMRILTVHYPERPMSHIWSALPEEDHLHHMPASENGVKQYQVCGKILQETAKIGYCYEILSKFHAAYGDRARKAELNEGIDWKAVSHAIRAAYQVEEILADNTITFPLKQADFIRDIKQGRLHYINDVAPVLEALMDKVERLSEKSSLPAKTNRTYWDRFIIDAVKGEYFDCEKIN